VKYSLIYTYIFALDQLIFSYFHRRYYKITNSYLLVWS